MPLLKRLSDSVWNLFSHAQKKSAANDQAGQENDAGRTARNADPHGEDDSVMKRMNGFLDSKKRKVPHEYLESPSLRPEKVLRVDDDSSGDEFLGSIPDFDNDTDYSADDASLRYYQKKQSSVFYNKYSSVDEDFDDPEIDEADIQNLPSPKAPETVEDVDDSGIVIFADNEYRNDTTNTLLLPGEEELIERGVGTKQLLAQGWPKYDIPLRQRLEMRGYEPLMPAQWKMLFSNMPSNLFCKTNDAPLSSLCGEFTRAEKALVRLFDLGRLMRDRAKLQGRITPEQEAKKQLLAYMKWANKDSGLDLNTAIPLVVIHTAVADTEPAEMRVDAEGKLAKLAARWREALEVKSSIEFTPSSTLTRQSLDLPTLYAFVATDMMIALMMYRPYDDKPTMKSLGYFEMDQKGYDVWNAFAFAIAICHCRNVQIRIAEETGLGLHDPWEVEEDSDDPDA